MANDYIKFSRPEFEVVGGSSISNILFESFLSFTQAISLQ